MAQILLSTPSCIPRSPLSMAGGRSAVNTNRAGRWPGRRRGMGRCVARDVVVGRHQGAAGGSTRCIRTLWPGSENALVLRKRQLERCAVHGAPILKCWRWSNPVLCGCVSFPCDLSEVPNGSQCGIARLLDERCLAGSGGQEVEQQVTARGREARPCRQMTLAMAWATASMLPVFNAATQMRPLSVP